ncbi:MAG TPA: lysylphosphatidylglycerol synthase transmembrane domain-containing protein [Dehalococcoidia bacterium]|nr:lysylphosphatidylglycerol synthase transmembrane domain-containing protein [Dehalococcoidia bacterium]
MNLKNIRNRLMISMLLGILVFAGLLAYGDFQHVGRDLKGFRWELLPLIFVLTLGNYLLRFAKWEYYLKRIGVTGLRRVDSFLIYFSGLGMTVTPGKIGEWLKSYLLKEVHGTPVTKSAPILIAERLTDSLGLLIIGATGVVVFGSRAWPLVVLIIVGALTAVAVSRHRPAAHALLRLAGRLPLVRRFVPHFEEFYESTYVLMQPTGVMLMTLVSVASWFFEVLAFYFTLVGLGVSGGADTLFKAAFILPISTLAAALLLTPGGLGVAETGITSLSEQLLHMGKGAATAGTLIVRVATLWFGVVLGLAMFALLTRRLGREGHHLDVGADAALAGPDPTV